MKPNDLPKWAPDPDVATGASASPRHVAIIMDGNGRWAAARGLPRIEGHRRGLEALRRAVETAADLGIAHLTLYSFSTENWSRPPDEVADLMGLLRLFVRRDLAVLNRSNVRVRVIGGRDDLPGDILRLLDEAETSTKANTGLTLVIAFNYGGRQEIVQAARRMAEAARDGTLDPETIDAALMARYLQTSDIPDPDLIIRTSGECRVSNFLLWQGAYAEFVFLPAHWPDFDRATFEGAIASFQARERRYGGRGARAGA